MISFECSNLNCKSNDFFLEKKGNSTGLYCADCGKWIKWLSKDEINAYTNLLKTKGTKVESNTSDIQCAACGFIGADKSWFNTHMGNKYKCCPQCGTIKYVCEENIMYRK